LAKHVAPPAMQLAIRCAHSAGVKIACAHCIDLAEALGHRGLATPVAPPAMQLAIRCAHSAGVFSACAHSDSKRLAKGLECDDQEQVSASRHIGDHWRG